jgi:DNA-nicking Smr family endonuclease
MEPGGLTELPIEDSLDLHSFLPADLPSLLAEYLELAGKKYREVRIVHGRGIGVQRERVRSILSRREDVSEYFDAPPERGGFGATVVRFRKRSESENWRKT